MKVLRAESVSLVGSESKMAIRKKLVDRVAEQVSAIPTDRFIVLDVTNALISCTGKPLATNAEVCAIMRCRGLARNTGMAIKRGDYKYTVWEKIGSSNFHSEGKENNDQTRGVKA
jgi:hypothetical protein